MTEFVEKVQIVGADGTPLTVNADGSIDITGGGGGGSVDSVVAGTNITVDATDPANPVVAAPSVVANSLFDANTVLAADTDNTPAAVTMGASSILARLAAGNIKAATIQEILGLYRGTAFPGGPATNDRFFRTDLGLEFYYDGTRWLTVNMFKQTVAQSLTGISATSGTQGYLATSTIGSGLDMWLVSMESTFQVATTNTGSAYWTLEFEKVVAAGTATSLGTIVTSADSPDTWVSRSTSIGAALGGVSTYKLIRAKATKTSTPGNLFYALALNYRLIGT